MFFLKRYHSLLKYPRFFVKTNLEPLMAFQMIPAFILSTYHLKKFSSPTSKSVLCRVVTYRTVSTLCVWPTSTGQCPRCAYGRHIPDSVHAVRMADIYRTVSTLCVWPTSTGQCPRCAYGRHLPDSVHAVHMADIYRTVSTLCIWPTSLCHLFAVQSN